MRNLNNMKNTEIKFNQINKTLILVLMILSISLYTLFTVLTIRMYQLSNFIDNSFLKHFNITNNIEGVIKKFNSFQDVIIMFGVLPELIIILILLFVLFKFEKNNKKTINSNIVHILIASIFSYFIYVNMLGNGIIDRILSKIYYYNLINICLTILFIFSLYYIIYKFVGIIKLIKNKKTQGILKQYKIFYYPFLIVALIVLVLNLFSSLTMSYIISQILNMISLSSFIVFTDIFNIPLNVNISEIVPPFLDNIFNFFNISLDFTLSSLGITNDLINNIFNTIVLDNIDANIDSFIVSKINGFLFVNIYNVIACLVVIVLSGIVEYWDKDKCYYNALLSVIGLISIYSINAMFFNVLKIGFIISFIVFMYIIIFKNKKRNEEVLKNIVNKYNDIKSLNNK